MMLVGNYYVAEVETTMYNDGFDGVFFRGWKNNFKFLSTTESGLYTPTDVRSILPITEHKATIFVLTNTNSVLTIYRYLCK